MYTRILFLKILERKFKSTIYMWIVAALSKVWVCGRSPAGIVGSNPARTWMLCVVQ